MRDIIATIKIDGDKLYVAYDEVYEHYLPDSTSGAIRHFLEEVAWKIAEDLDYERPWVSEEHYCPVCKCPPKSPRCNCKEKQPKEDDDERSNEM